MAKTKTKTKTKKKTRTKAQNKFVLAGKNTDAKGIKRFTKAWGAQFKIEFAKLK